MSHAIIDFSHNELPFPEQFQEVRDWCNEWITHDSFTLKTSGTTGAPKQVRHQKDAFIASAKRTNDFFGIHEDSLLMLALPVSGIGGRMMVVRAAVARCRLLCVIPSTNPIENLAISESISLAAFTPMQLHGILAHPHTALSQIQQIIIGGSPLDANLEQALLGLNLKAWESFGMTETLSHFALRQLGETAFTALGDVTFSQDQNDCLVVHDEAIHFLPIVTRDIIEWISDKQFRWKGRIDFMINSGGIKLHAEELEEKLKPVINRNFFISGEKDPVLGQKVVLTIEGPHDEELEQRIQTTDALGKYEKPKEIRFVPMFQRTASGKVLRH
ncbi:MAG: AMP-binding protein [Chitinophagales bacterium]